MAILSITDRIVDRTTVFGLFVKWTSVNTNLFTKYFGAQNLSANCFEYHVVSDHYRLFFISGLIIVKLKRHSIKLLTIVSAFKCNEENIPSSRSIDTIKSRFEL